MRMCRTYQLVMGVYVFLSACGEETDRNKSNKVISQPSQKTSTDQPIKVSVVRQGKVKTIVADRDYLTRAITDPDYD